MPPISSSKYFVIPFKSVPPNPTYTVWYATWSKDRPKEPGPGMSHPLVVGVTSEDRLPDGAVSLGGTKDPIPPPPPPPTFREEDYKKAFGKWQTYRRDQDE